MNQKLGGLEVSVKAFQRSYDLLAAQQANADKTMKKLKENLELIDSKKEALDAMKSAQNLGSDTSISDKFDELTDSIDDLFVKVESGMRIQTEKIADREQALSDSSDAGNDLLDKLDTADDTAARLDAIRGTGSDDGADPDDGADQ